MATYTIKAKSKADFSIPARYLFIESITAGLSARIRGIGENIETDHNIRAGSKIGQLPEVIQDWTIYNENNIDIDVEIQSGVVFYDENRTSGDINALTRYDNLSEDGNQFISGYNIPAVASTYSVIAFYNPPGSGIKTNIRVSRLCAYGNVISIRYIVDNDWALLTDLAPARNKILGGPDGKTRLGSGNLFSYIGLQRAQLSTDTYGTPTANDYGNSPIILNEGVGLCFLVMALNSQMTAVIECSEE